MTEIESKLTELEKRLSELEKSSTEVFNLVELLMSNMAISHATKH